MRFGRIRIGLKAGLVETSAQAEGHCLASFAVHKDPNSKSVLECKDSDCTAEFSFFVNEQFVA